MPEFDVLIAAGDIHDPASRGVLWLAERIDKPIVYVPGNHEWYAYRESFNVAEEAIKARAMGVHVGVHVLMDEAIVIGGVRFLGASLWTDYELYGTPEISMALANRQMNDHLLIFPERRGGPLQPAQAREWHKTSVAWLTRELRADAFAGPTVVITHHLPHPRSIAPQFDGDALTPAFCSDLSALDENSNAALWIHGHTHTHSSFDYVAGGTRVVCNPKGYGPLRIGGRFENPDFDPMKVVDI